MTHPDDQEIEILLKRARMKPAPPGLKERILGSAKADAARKPRLLRAAAVCAVLWIAIFGADAAVSHSQSMRMAAILDGRGISSSADAEEKIFLAEIDGVNGEAKTLLKRYLAGQETRRADPRIFLDATERRKGWIDYEN